MSKYKTVRIPEDLHMALKLQATKKKKLIREELEDIIREILNDKLDDINSELRGGQRTKEKKENKKL